MSAHVLPDILDRIEASSYSESSIELCCRLTDAATEIKRLRDALDDSALEYADALNSHIWNDEQCLEFIAIAMRHVHIKGDLSMNDIRLGQRFANAKHPQQELLV